MLDVVSSLEFISWLQGRCTMIDSARLANPSALDRGVFDRHDALVGLNGSFGIMVEVQAIPSYDSVFVVNVCHSIEACVGRLQERLGIFGVAACVRDGDVCF